MNAPKTPRSKPAPAAEAVESKTGRPAKSRAKSANKGKRKARRKVAAAALREEAPGNPAFFYDEVIISQGLQIPYVPAIITRPIERPLRNSRYEGGESLALKEILRPGDRVLELGAGIGLLSAIAALSPGVESVTAVEANPGLLPMIRETHRLNGVVSVDLRNAVVSGGSSEGGTLPFYIRQNFWASSMEPDTYGYVSVVEVPRLPLADLLDESRPTVIVCDIEGAELDLFEGVDLSKVRAVIVELHPKVYGTAGLSRVERTLFGHGFARKPGFEGSTVQRFERRNASAAPAIRGPWPPKSPRILIATCMKDEGPFILEWIAWHRAIGVTDIVVFTNHCSDGSDLLLDRLDAMGIVRHLPNPALATESTYYQPAALSFVQKMRVFREADFFLSIDVDEYVNIRTGKGRLADLFTATGPFDVLSLFELNHGSNRQESYQRGWVKDLFPMHQTERPGRHKCQRGVKSIVRLGPAIAEVRNHRPDLAAAPGEAVWLDGSARPMTALADDRGLNGGDCRGAYGLVTLDHYPLRALDSYLVKMFRGDVVVAGKKVSERYWRMRNRNEDMTSSFDRADQAARSEYHTLLADPELVALHEVTCAAHEARIAALLEDQEYRARRDWVLKNSW